SILSTANTRVRTSACACPSRFARAGRENPMRRPELLLAVLAGTALTSACTLVPIKQTPPPPASTPAQRADPSLAFVAAQLQLMEKLALGTPTEQADIAQAVKSTFDELPNIQNRLAYALVLATPG